MGSIFTRERQTRQLLIATINPVRKRSGGHMHKLSIVLHVVSAGEGSMVLKFSCDSKIDSRDILEVKIGKFDILVKKGKDDGHKARKSEKTI